MVVMQTWIIGSGNDCDLVVARQTVSGRHCRLTQVGDGYVVEDLGSSNGTYVNGSRIVSATHISRGDTVTLGLTVPMPWPAAAGAAEPTVIRIGRTADNDVVLDDPRVSGHHARLVVAGSRTLIEDLGSSNGTFLNSTDSKVTSGVPLSESDVVYFGSLAMPAARLLAARGKPAAEALVPPPLPSAPRPARAAAGAAAGLRAGDLWTIVLLAQAPVFALLILLAFGRRAGADAATAWTSVASGVAATTFALALAAVWMGGSLSAWALMTHGPLRDETHPAVRTAMSTVGSRLAILAALCFGLCAVMLLFVHWGSGLRGDWLPMLGLLVLACAVGLALGSLLFRLINAPKTALAVLAACLVPLIVLGGWMWPLPDLGVLLEPVSWAAPTRWAFEGLLLLETDRRKAPAEVEESLRDPAEHYFPAETRRMGPTADAMALTFLLVGLAAATIFISSGSKPLV
jgi:pSer/pThr/pTyr-binding forkhead associated (FHA) protein